MAADLDPRTPVLVGVGTSLDDAEAVELMARAALAAGQDAGPGADLLAAVQRISVPRGTWTYTDPGRIVAERIGASGATTHLIDLGIPQQTPIDQALASILGGELDVVLVTGAEARARAARAKGKGSAANTASVVALARRDEGAGDAEIDQHGATPDVQDSPKGEIVSGEEIRAGLLAPVEQYALIESALRAADGLDVDAHRRVVAELWSAMNEVARTNPEAAFPASLSAEDLLGPAAGRTLAFPYAKWHVSQWTVDQGAALLLCSVAAAELHGVPRDRWLFPLVGVESSWSLPLPKRAAMEAWPAMGVLGRAAAERWGRPLAEVDHVEIYSCFPAAVRVQQRELGLPADRVPTVTGGMAFAGGPFNNFVLQATVAMARKLRSEPGVGLVSTVSGFLTKPGLALWASEPDGRPPLVADLAAEAEAATESREVAEGYAGPATVAAVTVTSQGQVLAILDTPDGRRCVARDDDPAVADLATHEELIGREAAVADGRFTLP